VPRIGSGKHLKIIVEPAATDIKSAKLEQACEELAETFKTHIKLTPDLEIVDAGSLARFEGKGKRLIREE
jgi:phenylacetate-coenzyme A ligase PaaK-like adenylate-forming protein